MRPDTTVYIPVPLQVLGRILAVSLSMAGFRAEALEMEATGIWAWRDK
ncbi:MAG: hypothetical protein LBP22_09480 [Deltaproteobacteria bacterium]|nr:hypothetical protein [Deltaproteobacteria bacterium]